MSVYCTVVLVGPQLLIEKCREPPVLDGFVPLHPLPHEAVLELSQHNIHLQIFNSRLNMTMLSKEKKYH